MRVYFNTRRTFTLTFTFVCIFVAGRRSVLLISFFFFFLFSFHIFLDRLCCQWNNIEHINLYTILRMINCIFMSGQCPLSPPSNMHVLREWIGIAEARSCHTNEHTDTHTKKSNNKKISFVFPSFFLSLSRVCVGSLKAFPNKSSCFVVSCTVRNGIYSPESGTEIFPGNRSTIHALHTSAIE